MDRIDERAKKIRLVIFDVDGVLTDGSLFYGESGEEYKAFLSKDGLGMKMLQRSGVTIAVITARQSELLEHRMKNLEIKHLYQGAQDKRIAYNNIKTKLDLEDQHIAYVGDDVIDLPVMNQVGLAIAVKDAHPLVIEHAHWTTPRNGGRGAARDVCEFIMSSQGTLKPMLESYLS